MKTLARQLLSFNKFYIVGTSTDVGKTYIGTLLLSELLRLKSSIRPLKPIETGLQGQLVGPDTQAYLDVLATFGVTATANEVNKFNLDVPCSPHLSGKLQNISFELADIIAFVDQYEYAMIELAGGVSVPINMDKTQLDLIAARPYPCILVADAALGTLNHSLLTIQALESVGVTDVVVVLNRYDEANFIHQENLMYLNTHRPVFTVSEKNVKA
jgi:dethiobiotin synthetase